MRISATVQSSFAKHHSTVKTNNDTKNITISPKQSGYGSSVNGGELLMLALVTCFCNDLYREAAKRNIAIDSVEVECTGDFGAEGESGSNFQYTAHVSSASSQEEINELIKHTDTVAEIHNT